MDTGNQSATDKPGATAAGVGTRLRERLKGQGWNTQNFLEHLEADGARVAGSTAIYKYVRGDGTSVPPVEFLEDAAKVLGVRVAWLATGDGRPTDEEEGRAVVARHIGTTTEDGVVAAGDPFTEAALAGLRETLPLGAHLTFEWRGLSGTAIKLAQALQPQSQHEEKKTEAEKKHVREVAIEYHLEAGRLLGRCIDQPLKMLGVRLGIDEEYTAQAYIGAAAHAIDIIVHCATVKVDDAPGATEEADDAQE